MAINFAKVYEGAEKANPEGSLPKLNDPALGGGVFEIEIVKTAGFQSFLADGASFKAEVTVRASDNPNFRPGSAATVIIHNLEHKKDFVRSRAHANVKGLVSAAVANLYGDSEVPDGQDPSWPGLLQQCSQVEEQLKGARLRVQMSPSKSEAGFAFCKMSFFTIAQAA